MSKSVGAIFSSTLKRLLKRYSTLEIIRERVISTLFIMFIYRLLTFISLPSNVMDARGGMQNITESEFFLSLDIISGGAITNNSIVALSVGPYLAASSFLHFVTPFVSPLARWRNEGKDGSERLMLFQYCLTAVFSLICAFGLLSIFNFQSAHVIRSIAVVLELVAGTMLTCWLAEIITKYGYGDGITMILLGNTLSQSPYILFTSASEWGYIKFFIVLMTVIMLMVLYVIMREGRREVNYINMRHLRKTSRNPYDYRPKLPILVLPLKVELISQVYSNLVLIAGVFSIIQSNTTGVISYIAMNLTNLFLGRSSVSWLLFFLAVVFGATFASYSIIENEFRKIRMEFTNEIILIPGLRSESSERHFVRIATRIFSVGIFFLGIISLAPWIVEFTLGLKIPLLVFVSVWGLVDILVSLDRSVEVTHVLKGNYGFITEEE